MGNEPKRVLIVDDEATVQVVCKRILDREAYQAEIVPGPQQALARLKETHFDLVLTDLRMPGGMDGIELCKEIRRFSPNTRVVLMTAFPGVDSAVDTIRLGAADYLVKPFDAHELVDRIRTCLAIPEATA